MDFVTFEIAKKLKEENFIGNVEIGLQCGFYYKDGEDIDVFYDGYDNTDAAVDEYLRPTISQVLKWLREEKEVDLVIEPIFCYDKNIHREYGVRVFAPSLNKPVQCGYFNKWEKASIAGIEYVLDNLI